MDIKNTQEISVRMDIQLTPIKFKELIQLKSIENISDYTVLLQNTQILESSQKLSAQKSP